MTNAQEWKVTFYNKHCSYGPPIFLLVAADNEENAIETARDHTLNHARPYHPKATAYFEFVKIEPYNRPRGQVIR